MLAASLLHRSLIDATLLMPVATWVGCLAYLSYLWQRHVIQHQGSMRPMRSGRLGLEGAARAFEAASVGFVAPCAGSIAWCFNGSALAVPSLVCHVASRATFPPAESLGPLQLGVCYSFSGIRRGSGVVGLLAFLALGKPPRTEHLVGRGVEPEQGGELELEPGRKQGECVCFSC